MLQVVPSRRSPRVALQPNQQSQIGRAAEPRFPEWLRSLATSPTLVVQQSRESQIGCAAEQPFPEWLCNPTTILSHVISLAEKSSSPAEDSVACSEPRSISGLVAEYIVAIDVTRVRFPADAFVTALSPCLMVLPAKVA